MPLRYLIRLTSKSGQSKEAFLATVRSLSKSTGGSARNPKWTSYGALELDVFVESRPDLEVLESALAPISNVEFVRDLNVAPPHRPRAEIVAEARGYFNSERYWESHETFEALWRASSGAEKVLLQGIILVCAAYIHHQKGEWEVAVSILQRARKQLDWPERKFERIDLKNLRRRVERTLANKRFETFRI